MILVREPEKQQLGFENKMLAPSLYARQRGERRPKMPKEARFQMVGIANGTTLLPYSAVSADVFIAMIIKGTMSRKIVEYLFHSPLQIQTRETKYASADPFEYFP